VLMVPGTKTNLLSTQALRIQSQLSDMVAKTGGIIQSVKS